MLRCGHADPSAPVHRTCGRRPPERDTSRAGGPGGARVRRPRRRFWALVLLVAAVVATQLALSAAPAAACSCGGGAVPTVDFTGVAVEDLGYAGDSAGRRARG